MSNSKQNNYRLNFYQNEIISAKKGLFTCGSVRRAKAIQERIKYLDSKIIELGGG